MVDEILCADCHEPPEEDSEGERVIFLEDCQDGEVCGGCGGYWNGSEWLDAESRALVRRTRCRSCGARGLAADWARREYFLLRQVGCPNCSSGTLALELTEAEEERRQSAGGGAR